MSTKEWAAKEKNDKLYFIAMESFYIQRPHERNGKTSYRMVENICKWYA
jgi:hypothetical protein